MESCLTRSPDAAHKLPAHFLPWSRAQGHSGEGALSLWILQGTRLGPLMATWGSKVMEERPGSLHPPVTQRDLVGRSSGP